MGEPRSSTLTCIIICWIISRCSAATDPHHHHETSIFPQQFDYRYTPYADLISEIAVYQDEDIVDYTQLAVDKRHGWLLVGARDSLFKLSLDNLDLVQAVQLSPLDYKKTLCLNVNPKEKCHNYIRVLLLHNYTQINSQSDEDQALYICGTNAFDPLCTWRPLSNLSHILETETGVGKTPYDPSHNSTAIITSAGDFYGATNLGPDDRDPAIYRKEGPHTKSKALRTAQSNSMWLNEPEFVSSYEMGDVVLFFYREVAVEFINCGKRVYSRVARICKSDTGGAFDENIFTSFFKTRLNCSLPGEYPFYFDEIQSTFLLEHGTEKYIYAVFNTPMNSISGSAVCVYNITAFNNSFNGPFKYQETPRSAWERYEQKEQDRMTQCSINQPRDVRSNEIVPNKMTESKYQLMDEAVQPEKFMPLLHAENERWTHIAVDTVNTKHGIIKVLFIATDDGKLRKMAKIPQDSKTGEYCLIEEMKIVPNGDRKPVKALLLSSDKMALFISTQNHILKVPVQRCARFNSRTMCINANDPYCGWDMTLEACTVAPSGQPEVHYWEQPLSDCPVIEYPVDGNWSSWTGWEKCSQVGDDPTSGDCQCRSRTCDNPKPYHGGNPCQGASVQVTNCTAHGQWTDWSTWSSCSQTCGSTAIRQRYRYCSNPPPKFGGRSCIGPDSEEDYCQGHPPCPLPPVKGEWTSWAEWNECSANCNGGIQTRRRACQHPLRAVDTIPCNGNTQEWRMCNIQLCEELQQNTPWTPWIATNHTKGGYFENRYRFTCRAKVPSQTLIKAKHLKTQTRFCFDGGKCHDSEKSLIENIDGGWTEWNQWSSCSKDCDGGIKWRRRHCNNPAPMGSGHECIGHAKEGQDCNTHSCQGSWGCWSSMSVCSVTCGQGITSRTRICSSMPPGYKYNTPCTGASEEFSNCDMGPCKPIAVASSMAGSYMERPRFSLAQMFLVGGLSFFLGGSAAIALYAYVSSFRRAMKDAKEMEHAQKMDKKMREQQRMLKRQSQASMQYSMRHEPSMASHTSIENMFGGRNKVYDVETVMKDVMLNKDEPYYSTLDRKCPLQTFTIKDL